MFILSSFLANLLATIFMILNLNSIMNVIFNVPAAIVSTVCLVPSREKEKKLDI